MAKLFTFILALFASVPASVRAEMAGKTAHDFAFTSIDGGALPMSGFAGKAVLVVNTASLLRLHAPVPGSAGAVGTL